MPKASWKLTKAQRLEIIAMASEYQGARPKWKLEYIAALYGTTKANIGALLRRNGVPYRRIPSRPHSTPRPFPSGIFKGRMK